MMYLDWFVNTMKTKFHIDVKEEEVSYEGFEFYHEEIDELLIPAAHLEKLPNPLLLETLSYVDETGYEWIAGAVIDKKTEEIVYEVWIKNGEPLVQELHK